MSGDSTSGFGARLLLLVGIMSVVVGGLPLRHHRSGRITGLASSLEDDLESVIDSIESVVASSMSDALSSSISDAVTDIVEDRAAGWWSWVWRTITRAGPPPLEIELPEGDPCEGLVDCMQELATHLWDFLAFAFEQLRLLLVDPAAWSRQVHEKFDEQLSQLRAVEHVLFGAVSWMVVVNLLIALGFTIYYFQDQRRRLHACIEWVPLLRLSRMGWRWLTNQRKQNSMDQKLDALAASVNALQSKLTDSSRATAFAVKQSEGGQRGPIQARGSGCWWCGSQDHLQRNCPLRPRLPASPCRRCGGRHWTDQCPETEQAAAVNGSQTIESRRRLYRVAGQVAEGTRRSNVKLLVDSGSSVNLLPKSVCEEIGAVVRASPTNEIHSFAGDVHSVLGQVSLATTIGDSKKQLTYLVAAKVPSVILGVPGLQDFGMTIDCNTDSLTTAEGAQVFCHRVDSVSPATQQKN